MAKVIKNAISSGMTFSSSSGIGADAFSSISQSFAQSIEKATSGKEIQMKVSMIIKKIIHFL